MNIRSIFYCGFCLLFLTWCFNASKSSTDIQIQASYFTLLLDSSFVPVNSALIENKQIIDKIIWSWKKTNKSWFDTSLVFTESTIDPLLQTEQFVTLNNKKYLTELSWFVPWMREFTNLYCNNDIIKALQIEFTLKNWLLDDYQILYFIQLQFVYNKKWYILSYLTNTNSDINEIKSTLNSLSCKL